MLTGADWLVLVGKLDGQGGLPISGQGHQKSMAALSVPGAAHIPCYIMSLGAADFPSL